ncbi:hypothetical protein L202_08413 [Cryptococcus amylolentus CBS 6039]|uniref:Protein phosphatase n=1 Tax=Cryptococcus amylolentus CBS 6039 TaxID=1295533 RepID=A0A1E3HA41_9TREE|nr:hypothetical protein L202_08413 [Cryptococcus amylolentus CBS 6039]ODN73015.1 hypothetical protein L202_08413 [Cryptococcus amylolentus CBS 6039]
MSLLASARHITPAHRLAPLLRRANSTTVSPLYPHAPVYSYAMGLSYAAKYSPPFISTKQEIKPYGLDHKQDEVGEWVREMLDLNAGRGDIRASLEEIKEVRRKYGAGEDFFGLTSTRGDLHLAVSDGVGGWSETLDASLFPQLLCYYYTKAARDLAMSSTGSVDPKSILKKAYEDALADDRANGGGATMVSARLDEDGQGVFSNLGDSGYLILRGDEIFEISKPQTHFFNCPKQLSKIPAEMRHQKIIHDTPDIADVKSFELKAGDTIALFTDGFSDNVPTSHIPSLSTLLNRILNDPANASLSHAERASERARLFADMLVGYGRSAMQRTGEETGANGWKTPFEEEAAVKQPKWGWKGGKYDDITVVTAVVTEVD